MLLWDLSAAFDCLDSGILCEKLELYGLDKNSVKWFSSFLTGRTQKVRIIQSLSKTKISLLVSPLLYIIYVADLQVWLKYVTAITYADDTSTSISHKLLLSGSSKNLTFILKNSANNLIFDSIFDSRLSYSTSIHQFYYSASTRL